jgi:hypothetical protein
VQLRLKVLSATRVLLLLLRLTHQRHALSVCSVSLSMLAVSCAALHS